MDIDYQIELFERGTRFIKLLRPASINDGILKPTERLKREAIDHFRVQASKHRLLKFVPASGAASRMFKELYHWVENPEKHSAEINEFFSKVEQLAIFEEWMTAVDKADVETYESGLESKVRWLQVLLDDSFMGLASKPKGVISFHQYKGDIATPIEEHFHESLAYGAVEGKSKVHFTISPNHQKLFEDVVNAVISKPTFHDKEIEVAYSNQSPETDTLTLGRDGPMRDKIGALMLRPGGHGALLKNLNELDADLVYIKNIDNVAHRRLLNETTKHKQILAGLLLLLREDLKLLKQRIQKGVVDHNVISELRDKWHLHIPYEYPEVKKYLNRPIRVCGMVKNDGEPGGGPFWCVDQITGESLQIVEQAQINVTDFGQLSILKSSTHFNPVDLVCYLTDLDGRKIDLREFTDPNTYFIAEKSIEGKSVKVLEWPGLWNGAMAKWITVFVEVPISTFNPVKTISDLFRAAHN